MLYEAVGTLHKVFPEQQVSERFRKREFILTIQDGMYPQYIKFTLTQDRCQLIDGYAPGAELKVTFALSGREWQGSNGEPMYFTNLEARKIEPHSSVPGANPLSQEPSFDPGDEVPF